ncbi:hypothetical protein MATL_G00101630 [Megalops atlanticus]|uniref:Reverse transcriptase n=1 Tax=Megalops atlanticus TaxID=7932 RepID=A0A9D3TDJ3_MEGAT|nr:hypothetical protein MATL_G00101630 [Megalops atlanticus]
MDRLADISLWMKARHLQLNLSKTELLVIPAKPSMHHSISLKLVSNTLKPSKVARNLGVMIDDQLSFSDHVASVSWLCRFARYNIRKIRPYLTQYATQRLVQAMVIYRLDYCNALLAGLPACVVKLACLVFDQPKRAHVTPLLIELHWLPVAARIRFKSLMLAYTVTSGSAPKYLSSIIQAYSPSRLALPSLHTRQPQSRLFSYVVPRWWNELPYAIRAGVSLSIFKNLLKTQLF